MRVRAAAVDPNPMDSAAIMMAAEAVNSTEPIRSMFIGYSFLIDHALFVRPTGASCAREPLLCRRETTATPSIIHFSIMRVYTPFIVKEFIWLVPSDVTVDRTAAGPAQRSCLLASKTPKQPTPF